MTANEFRRLALDLPEASKARTWIIPIFVSPERSSRPSDIPQKAGEW
jgi:hypothetical protein